MAEFKVGGKVVCVKDHSRGRVKKGQVFTIIDIIDAHCSCDYLLLDIGIKPLSTDGLVSVCSACGGKFYTNPEVHFFSSVLFVPIDDFKEVTFTKLLEEMPVGVQ